VTTTPDETRERSDAHVVRLVVVAALAVQVALLAITGVVLVLFYRPAAPSPAQAWSVVQLVRVVHRVMSMLLLPSAVVGAVVMAIRPRRGVAAATALAVTAAAATFTGYLLPWDQLALWAVTVGSRIEGYRWVFDDRVRFVLLGGTEVGTDTITRWLAVHLALGLAAAALVVPIARRTTTGATPSLPSPPPTSGPTTR
jgi:quinol-cytochrome oxidoreductase complex cytochrome b subunit